MSRPRRITSALLLVIAWSCADPASVREGIDTLDVDDFGPSLSVVAALPAVCGAATLTPLIADETVPVGTVRATQDGTHLYVVYRTDVGWPIHKTALYVGSSAGGIPTNHNGNPRVGRFPYVSLHAGLGEVVWKIPLASLPSSDVVLAAFAEVGATWEGAWGQGPEITAGRSWAMYFTHRVSGCAAATVDAAGGTVATTGGGASLAIPAGALPTATDITIDPATIEDLLDHAAGLGQTQVASTSSAAQPAATPAAVDLADATVFGVTPISGTIWDLGPDGLEFLTPATITLAYDEAAIPAGATEQDLRVYIINGIFDELPSTLDPDANTITAEIGHFTFAFTAVDLGADVDLELTTLSSSSDPTVGQPVAFTADVRNNGPGFARGGSVLYEAQGTVRVGIVEDDCREVAPTFGDFAVSCRLPDLLVGELASAPPLHVVPLEAGTPFTVRATAVASDRDRDLEPDNDIRELTVTPGGSGAIVDLKAGFFAVPGSDLRVGGLIGWTGSIVNLGEGTSNGGTMRLEAVGDIELGTVPALCTQVDYERGVRAAISCPVEPLAPFDQDFVGPLRITPLSPGDVQITASVTPAPADIDTNPDNNVGTGTFTYAATFLVDLAPSSPSVSGIRDVGERVTFQTYVGNFKAPSNGGVIIYEAIGDVIFGAVESSCTASVPDPSALALACPFDPFPLALSPAPASYLEVIAFSPGLVTFRATTFPVNGDTDVNPSNDQLEIIVPVGQRTVDLSVGAVAPTTATLGEPAEFSATVTNHGPADGAGLRVFYELQAGDAELATLPDSCLEGRGAPRPSIRCDIPPLAAGSTSAVPPFRLIPRSIAPLVVTAQALPVYPTLDFDPDRSNNLSVAGVEVGPGD
jgi:hypothetical protein